MLCLFVQRVVSTAGNVALLCFMVGARGFMLVLWWVFMSGCSLVPKCVRVCFTFNLSS